MNTLYQCSHVFALLPRRTTTSLSSRALAFHLRPQPQQRQQCRPFITNPFTPSVQSLSATRTLPYPAKAIYSIIADVSQYSAFLPYCQDSSITRYSSPDADGKKWPSEAKLVVGWNNISETFYSRIYCVPGSIVEAVGGATKTTVKEEEIAHHESGRTTEVEDKTTDESILTHLMTRWTVKPFPYKPPPPSNNVPSDLPAREQTEVSLAIEFQFANPLYGSMSKAVAPKVAGMMIEAFEQRVKSVLDGPGYGALGAQKAKSPTCRHCVQSKARPAVLSDVPFATAPYLAPLQINLQQHHKSKHGCFDADEASSFLSAVSTAFEAEAEPSMAAKLNCRTRFVVVAALLLPLFVGLFFLARHFQDLSNQYEAPAYVWDYVKDLSSSRPDRQPLLGVGKPEDRVIVLARLERENVDWVEELLPRWQHAVYTVDPPTNISTNTLVTPVNKGHESMAYLTYIIDNFHSLPTTIAFLHSHHSGFFNAWHTDAPMHDNVYAMKHLQLDFVQRSGYVNLRCKWNPGCKKAHRRNTHITPEVWQEVFDGTSTPPVMSNGTSETDPDVAEKAVHVPAEVATACCAQFAVSREQVLKRPLEDYVKFRLWIVDTKLDDAKSGRVMEYLWHIIFGMDAVSCPDEEVCYCLIVSIYDIGCAIGCLGSFTFGEHVGRKKMIIAGASTMIIGTVILASATTLAQLLVGRIVTGIGNGFNSSNIPVYQSELCDASIRGRLVSLQGTITIVGLCIAYWMDYGLSFVSGPVQWRLPIAFQGLFAIGLLFQILPLPDSPRWLIEAEQKDKASEVLARLVLGDKADVTHPDVVHQRRQIETSLAIESAGGPFRYKELLQGGEVQNFRRIVLCCAVNLMQQFTGANMINYYAPIVYQNAMGLSRNMSLILGGCTSMTYLAASFIPLWTVDRYGRRALLMFSAAGMCFCFSMTSILLSVGSLGAAYGATAMVFLFQVFLGVGWLPIPWLYPAEVTTTRIRSRGQSIGVFLNWMCVFTVVQITPIAIGNIGWHTFIIFAIFCALWVPIVYAFFPETNQLELEDLDHIFTSGDKITRGVWGAKGGYTVRRHAHERDIGGDVGGDKAHDKKAGHGVLDLEHMPYGCGTCPTGQTSESPYSLVRKTRLPTSASGEIDIIKGVHDQTTNLMTLHTSDNCSITNDNMFTGSISTTNCFVNAPGQSNNAGCSIHTTNTQTYGAGFDAINGGVYATEWTSDAISIWFFPRNVIPRDIRNGHPNPQSWGEPISQFQGACDLDSHIKDQQIVFDNTFCGDWAGNVWTSDATCGPKAATCNDFVANNPDAFTDAYWTINSLRVY
ncbi:hypothetical protein B0A49_07712 [Cryomyces minteri]|uniref:Major facilitator superfamily (MFS) profile domain-containing protein n=1 Tax=Cryomyces minteri TaxID=331657 RepID=A0A4U0XA77_9PEZI|nr:hypothetical protein B0A49_07712 [Cryomyces minteri]